jgi:hypothetical protein
MKHKQHRKLWIVVKRLWANTSIMPPFIHHRYIYIATTTTYCMGDWFYMDEPFFHPRNEIWKNARQFMLIVESFITWVFKSKFGIFLCRRNEMRKMIIKSNIQLKTMNDTGWMSFLWNRRLFGAHRPLNKSMIFYHIRSTTASPESMESLGKNLFLFYYFIWFHRRELEWKKL